MGGAHHANAERAESVGKLLTTARHHSEPPNSRGTPATCVGEGRHRGSRFQLHSAPVRTRGCAEQTTITASLPARAQGGTPVPRSVPPPCSEQCPSALQGQWSRTEGPEQAGKRDVIPPLFPSALCPAGYPIGKDKVRAKAQRRGSTRRPLTHTLCR